MKEKIIVANASGFWGDELAAIQRQVHLGPIDYLTMDYLAEITMIILSKQKAKNPDAGFAQDFVQALDSILEDVASRNITVISNAGGMNPVACAEAIRKRVEAKNLNLPIAVVDGDDLMPQVSSLASKGHEFKHLITGEPLGERLENVVSANAYTGARPIVSALGMGARIIITGRTYDAASVVAPIAYEFGWNFEDYDKLASALLAGHLIECGPQVTGGNYSQWHEVSSYSNMGYPFVEVRPDGSFVIAKHPKTGGLINSKTVKEQLMYEIGDPRQYISPDVVADFTSFHLKDVGTNRVFVQGGKGTVPPPELKVSMNYEYGYKVVGLLVVSGPDVLKKCDVFSQIFWERVGNDFEKTRTDYVGFNGCWGPAAPHGNEPNEIILRFAALSREKGPLLKMSRELSGLVLSGPPGVTVFGGRPKVTQAFGYWPALIDRQAVTSRLLMDERELYFYTDSEPSAALATPESNDERALDRPQKTVDVPLSAVAHTRSGDKGDICNIGVAALDPKFYPELVRELTPEKISRFFEGIVKGKTERFLLENIHGMNFVLHEALDVGGTISLALDNQGKTLEQALLNMTISVDMKVYEEIRPDSSEFGHAECSCAS